MKNSKKVVIKLGSSLLTNKRGGVNRAVLKNVVKDIVWLLNLKKEIIVVSSGAISLGRGKLNIKNELIFNSLVQRYNIKNNKCIDKNLVNKIILELI